MEVTGCAPARRSRRIVMLRYLPPVGFVVCLGVRRAIPTAVAAQPPGPGRAGRAEDELVDKVRKTIDNGVTYLKKEQNEKGNWEGIVLNLLADMEGGVTSLATL